MPTSHAVPQPELTASAGETNGTSYRRTYRLFGRAGTCLLQRVRVRIRYRSGTQVLVDYRGIYHEFFAFAQDGAVVVDVHDFDVVRDGWRQAAIEQLLRRHLPAGFVRSRKGIPRLDVHKAFTLGEGAVLGTRPIDVAPGVTFGFLESGHDGPSRVRLTVGAGPEMPRHAIAGLSPCPSRQTIAGSGTFVGRRGWRASERFHYSFACLSGSLRDRNGYRPATLPAARSL
ncbi:MAG TPA: hypothetical protein VFZ65_10910 [Planctomycetota bacterium]|nr:hypothetical protein [Planctomycetota bacterium]